KYGKRGPRRKYLTNGGRHGPGRPIRNRWTFVKVGVGFITWKALTARGIIAKWIIVPSFQINHLRPKTHSATKMEIPTMNFQRCAGKIPSCPQATEQE